MLQKSITAVLKKDAMTIESKSWIEVILEKNPAMQIWLELFKNSVIADSEENPTVRTEVLSLSPEIDR